MAIIEEHDLEDVDFDYEEDPDLWRKARAESWLQWDAEDKHRSPRTVPLAELEARVNLLGEWPCSPAESRVDPRCGCDAPEVCEWDDTEILGEILAQRKAEPF